MTVSDNPGTTALPGNLITPAGKDSGDTHGPGFARLTSEDFAPATKGGDAQVSTRPSLSYWKDAWIRLKKNNQALASLGVIIVMLAFTLLGPFIWRLDSAEQIMGRISEAPTLNKQVLVLPEAAEWVDVVASEQPESPEADGAALLAPTTFELVGDPSTQSIGLRWSHVAGAAGYVIYRSTVEPTNHSNLGVPIGEAYAGNQLSYQDTFDLKAGTYHYSVVAKNLSESQEHATLKVAVPAALPIHEAQALKADAQPGEMIALPARPLGTDYLGRDMLARLMAGARVSLFIGFFAPFLAILIGIAMGGVAGFFGGKVDHYLMRFTDFVLALPFLLFMILFKVAFGAGPGEDGIGPMLVAMVLLSWTGSARLTRGQVLQLRESEFVQASRLLGARPIYLILRHLLPNTLGVILVSLTFAIPSAIFTEAFLSFIGMGVAPPTPSWGSMCNDGIKTFLTHPHEFIFPALFIAVTVLAFNLLGDGLRDALDPKMRSAE